MRVLIVSASMGAGHDGAARELARRLERDGHAARIVDLLDAPRLHVGPAFRVAYEAQLRFAPWAYQLTYRLWYRLPFLIGPVTRFLNVLTGRQLLRWIAEWRADIVVSTYPLASLALGRRRQKGQLAIPVVTYVTDFAVHPLLVHRAVDVHLCVHPQSAAKAAARVPGRVGAPGPLVSPRFFASRPSRAEARRRLGLRPDERAILIVAGSWGVGDVVEAFDVLAASERYSPVVVCGRNEVLAAQLRRRGVGHIFGWTDEMATLMRACDAVVQNAGGLTCMEAFASGLPVVSFRPIPGHGIENAEDMETAGVAAFVRKAGDLLPTLDLLTGPRRSAARAAGKAMFSGDAAQDVRVAATMGPITLPVRPARRRIAIGVAAATAFYGTFTLGVGVAAAHGIGVSHAPRRSDNVFIAVRLSDTTAADSGVQSALARLRPSVVIGGDVARDEPRAVAGLHAAGLEVDNGGTVRRTGRAIARVTGERARVFVPSRRLTGFELVAARLGHERIVVSRRVDVDSARLRPGGIYVVDGRHVSPAELVGILDELASDAAAEHVVPAPLGEL